MLTVLSISVPALSPATEPKEYPHRQFIREWPGPILPMDATVYPFSSIEWDVPFEVADIIIHAANELIIIDCDTAEWDANIYDEEDTLIDMEADLRKAGWLPYSEFFAGLTCTCPHCANLKNTEGRPSAAQLTALDAAIVDVVVDKLDELSQHRPHNPYRTHPGTN